MRMMKAREINRVAISAAIIAICSWICIPGTVPYTLQTFGVFLVAGFFGARKGFMAVLVYIILGAIGLPVFSAGRSGLGALLGETGGYIMAFLPAAYLCGRICEKNEKSTAIHILAMLLGLIVCYTLGTLWAAFAYLKNSESLGLWVLLCRFVLPFIVPDLAKIILAVFLVGKLKKRGIG